MAKTDNKLRSVINKADIVIADGIPIVWSTRRANIAGVHRVTGIDLAEALIARSQCERWSLFFFGASQANLDKAVFNLRNKHQKLRIAGSRNGYFSDAEISDILHQIDDASPDILFLGLGLPQKEHFIHDYMREINCRFCLPVGRALDIWADAKKRAPELVRRSGMEWLYRSCDDISRAKCVLNHIGTFARDFASHRKARADSR